MSTSERGSGDTITARLDRWLSRPAASFGAVLAGLVLALPSIGTGFFADDDALLAVLDRRLPFNPPWYDLYRFSPSRPADTVALIARGEFPWWTAPDLRLHLVRPLSSALLALDHAVFGFWAVGYHLHSVLWWALLLFGARSLFRRILPAPTAALGLLVFAVAGAHVHPYAWISARHCLVATVPCVVGLDAAVRAREDDWRPGRWLAPLAMIVGLAGGEMALGGLAFWASYELLGPARAAAWRARLLHAAVPCAILAAYLLAYAAAGGGARSSGGYVDPSTPGLFLRAASGRAPALLASALVGIPAELALLVPNPAPFVALAIFGAALVAFLWRACAPWLDPAERAAMRWLVPGALLSMLGAVGGFPGSRQLLLANLAWAALFAIVLRHAFRPSEASRGRVLLRRSAAGLELLLHLALPPLVVLGITANQAQVGRAVAELARGPAYVEGPPDRTVLVVQASDPMAFLYPRALLAREQDPAAYAGACFSLLSGAKADVRITRTGASTFTIETLARSFLRAPFETLYRAGPGFRVGDEVTVCGGRVRVLAIDEAARPTRIEMAVDTTLDDPAVRLVAWDARALRTLHLAPGDSIAIPWTPGPMGSF